MIELSELQQKLEELSTIPNLQEIRKLAKDVQPIDFAEVLNKLDDKLIFRIIRMLDNEKTAEIFPHLTSQIQEAIINAFSNGEIKEIIDELYSDDLIDVIDDMPATIVKKILKTTSPEKRAELNNILKYDEKTAGGMMSVNFVEIQETSTIQEAIDQIRINHENFETIDDLYVIDSFGSVKGWLEFKELVFNQPTNLISEIMDSSVITVKIDTDQEQVGQIFKRYDVNTIPVVDKKNKMVGIITVDDVIDVIEEEATEDMAKLAGISKLEDSYFETGIFKMVKSRLPWLLIMLVLGTITQILLIVFFNIYNINETTMNPKGYYAIMMLTPMILLLSAIAGISGNQSATLIVRSISLHEIKDNKVRKILLKELIISFLIAQIIVALNVLRLVIIYAAQFQTLKDPAIWAAIGSSSLALIIAIIFANVLGCLLPFGAKALKFDPTIVTSPLIIAIIDIVTVGVFFGIGIALF